uniref:T-box domain-containing protein n=1 Tax=Macrostomum lignano TaxID=282301 RepID=A0A1I8FBN4_9PLAT
MFPAFKVSLTHLEPDASYSVLLEAAVQGDAARHRFVGGAWTVSPTTLKKASPSRRPRPVRAHPDSPAPGRHWMARPVSFHRLKLTNSEEQADRLGHPNPNPRRSAGPAQHAPVLPEASPGPTGQSGAPEPLGWHSFTFKETEFIAVTAYQNEKHHAILVHVVVGIVRVPQRAAHVHGQAGAQPQPALVRLHAARRLEGVQPGVIGPRIAAHGGSVVHVLAVHQLSQAGQASERLAVKLVFSSLNFVPNKSKPKPEPHRAPGCAAPATLRTKTSAVRFGHGITDRTRRLNAPKLNRRQRAGAVRMAKAMQLGNLAHANEQDFGSLTPDRSGIAKRGSMQSSTCVLTRVKVAFSEQPVDKSAAAWEMQRSSWARRAARMLEWQAGAAAEAWAATGGWRGPAHLS